MSGHDDKDKAGASTPTVEELAAMFRDLMTKISPRMAVWETKLATTSASSMPPVFPCGGVPGYGPTTTTPTIIDAQQIQDAGARLQ